MYAPVEFCQESKVMLALGRFGGFASTPPARQQTPTDDKPFVIRRVGHRVPNQVCTTTFTIDPQGSWVANTRFTNRHGLEWAQLRAVLALLDSVGRPALALSQFGDVPPAQEAVANNRGVIDLSSEMLRASGSSRCMVYNPEDEASFVTSAQATINCITPDAPCQVGASD